MPKLIVPLVLITVGVAVSALFMRRGQPPRRLVETGEVEASAADTTVAKAAPDSPESRLPESVAGEPRRVTPASTAGAVEPIDKAGSELSILINDSLEGIFYLDHTLDQLSEFAMLPASIRVDHDYEDDDSVAYRLEGLPPGVDAHLLVGMQPFERDGQEYRYLQLEVQLDALDEPQFFKDAYREGPRIHISVDYDERGEPGWMALLAERRVSLSKSRKMGIDAYRGRYTSGASIKVDLDNPQECWARTFGIVNGVHVSGQEFQGVPLRGDLGIDPSRIKDLLALIQSQYAKIRSQKRKL